MKKFVEAPASSANTQVVELGYLELYDAVAESMYAFVAYRETAVDTGKWEFRIKSANTAGTTIDPDNSFLDGYILKALGKGETYFVWGFNLTPSPGDPRLVENRIYFDEERNITSVELHLITRKADSSPNEEKVLKIDWPA